LSARSFVEEYFGWADREKWLVLRDVAYNRLRKILFSSPETVDNVSEQEFRRDFLSFGSVIMNNYEYKLTVTNIPRFLGRFTVSRLEELVKSKEINVIGNASWSQIHMGFRKDKWQQVRDGIKHLLFGDDNKSLNEIEETKVYSRLGRVMQTDLSIPGFGRAKVTPLLLICDRKNRFGVWNSVSDEALHELRLKHHADITKNRSLSEYIRANEQLNYLKNEYSFNDLVDLDLFLWYFLDRIKKGRKRPGKKPPKGGERTNFFEDISIFEKEIRSFIVEKLYDKYSDLWILRLPKEVRKNWEIRRQKDIDEGKSPEREMINYADFSDYKEIIFFNWRKIFYYYFKDGEKMRVKLDDLRLVRNLIMHGRTLSRDEIGLAKTSIQWLRSKLKVAE